MSRTFRNLTQAENLRDTIIRSGFSLGGENLTLLGHEINLNGVSSTESNWNSVIKSVNATLFKARSLNLCTLGKITVVKSFVLGRIAYTGRTIPLTENADENLTTKICSFLNEGETRFTNETIFRAKKYLGLGIPNIKSFCNALLIKNLSRFTSNDEVWGKILKGKFFGGRPDRCLTKSNLSDSLLEGAKAFVSMGINYYNKYPRRAPLFSSPVVKSWSPHNDLGGPPPNVFSVELKERAFDIKVSELSQIDPSYENITNLLGGNPGPAYLLRLRGGAGIIKKKIDNNLSGSEICFSQFLARVKSSRDLRNVFDSPIAEISSRIDEYLCRVTGRSFNSNYLFKVFSKKVLTLKTRNFFLKLQHNKLLSRAQRAHFSDISPNCLACGEQENTAHLIYRCQHFQECIQNTALYFGFQKIEILAALEGEGRSGIVETIIMGACILAALISSSRGKKVSAAMMTNLSKKTLQFYLSTFKAVEIFSSRFHDWL